MEMKIENGKFYVLEMKNDKWIYGTEKEAIKSLKSLISTNENLNPEGTNLLEADLNGKQWSVKGVPWSKIAMQLMKDEK